MLGVGIVVRGRVRVDDPHESLGGRGVPVHVDNRRVGGLLERQVGRDLGHAQQRVAVIQDLRGLVRLRGEEEVRGTELDRVQELVPHVAHGRATVAGERRGNLATHRGVIRVVELLRVGAFGSSDDGVVGRTGAEVDAFLVVTHFTDRGHGLLPVGRQAVTGQLVAVGGDSAVAVRVDGVLVDPGLLLGGQAREVELAHGDHRVAPFPAHVVAIDLHAGVEAVVEARLLELLDGLRDDLGVQETHLGGQCVVVELTGRGRRRRIVVRLVVDVIEPVCGQRRINVSLNVGRLKGALIGAHAELLDEGRVGASQNEGGDDGDRHAGDRQAPRALEGRDDEEDRDEAGDDRQNRVRRQRRVDIGVHGAVNGAGIRSEQLVAAQPVVHADKQGQAGRHHAGLQARLLGGVRTRGEANRPVQVGHDDCCDQADAGDRHEEGDEHLKCGQDEHKEGDVQPELGVNLPEGGTVEELQECAPFGGQARAVGEAKEESDAPEREATHRFECLLVAAQGSRGLAAGRGRTMPVGEGHREEDQGRRHDEANDK